MDDRLTTEDIRKAVELLEGKPKQALFSSVEVKQPALVFGGPRRGGQYEFGFIIKDKKKE